MVKKNSVNMKKGVMIYYIRKDFRNIFEHAIDLFQRDPEIKAMAVKEDAGLCSIGISSLIFKYVSEKDPEFLRSLRSPNA
jgi:hypothetical protein